MREVITNTTNLQVLRIKLESLLPSSETYNKLTDEEKQKFNLIISEIIK